MSLLKFYQSISTATSPGKLFAAFLLATLSFKTHAQMRTTDDTLAPIKDVVKHSQFSPNVRIGPEWKKPRGVGIGFLKPSERNIVPEYRSQTTEIVVEQNKLFNPLLILHSKQPTTVLITALLNYQQTSFTLDNREGLLHEVTIQPGGDYEIPISLNINHCGYHDLIIAAFIDPYNSSMDNHYRASRSGRVAGRRTVIHKRGCDTINNNLPATLKGSPVPKDIRLNLNANFAKVSIDEHPSQLNQQLYTDTLSSGSPYQLRSWVSNLNGRSASDYALMFFHNYRQIKIKKRSALKFHLHPDEEFTSLLSTEEALTQGIHQLQTIHVFDPYRSILEGEVRAAFVFSSPRIAIQAR
ncbi:hypothetical protein [Pleionea sp. CnH1-48]|uniref:hypothetical protein n=1 Tax=Pleionea sp. CnH1-48 TaxID=2954494 RepID=UPI0020968AFF|nr:hypothetical protein [Pleionea sp. CnH1-48]MCO7224048.1 hypothetical protein [Pleionea sp. CnH1-48]